MSFSLKSDIRELIPEHYLSIEYMLNLNCIDLGEYYCGKDKFHLDDLIVSEKPINDDELVIYVNILI